jgi:hypothetical protein
MKVQTKYGEVEMTSEQKTEWDKQQSLEGWSGSHNQHMRSDRSQLVAKVKDINGIATIDPKTAKQHMRRIDKFETMLSRVAPGSGLNIEYIEFERFTSLMKDYQTAIDKGISHNTAHEEIGFQPVSVYVNKLYRPQKDGTTKIIRKLFNLEVGVRPNGTVVCLKDKFPGDVGTLVVPGADLKSK